MYIDEKYYDDENFVANQKKFLKRYNNIYISEEQKIILDKYNIDVNKYQSLTQLVYDIEEYLNDSINELEDLEWVSETLSEYNYYNNVNK